MGDRVFDLFPRRCAQCGKRFEGSMEWSYKIQKQKGRDVYFYFCSWHCIQAWRKKREKVKVYSFI